MHSKFILEVQYLPGKDNVVADALSRCAYPACRAFQDVSKHGSAQSKLETEQEFALESERERSGQYTAHAHQGASARVDHDADLA